MFSFLSFIFSSFHSSLFNISLRRLIALCKKESYQILRDPSSGLIAFFLPVLLLFIFGYGINLDANKLKLGMIDESHSQESLRLIQTFEGSPFIELHLADNRKIMTQKLSTGEIRAMIVIPEDFAQTLYNQPKQNNDRVNAIQLITDGSEPNIANFARSYVQAIWQSWQQQQVEMGSQQTHKNRLPTIQIETRVWYNPAAQSQHFIIPGAISIIMTVIGAILTSLVIAREWERGTMEALLSTQITRAELLLSKLIPYYILGMLAMSICMALALLVIKIPFRGSWLWLWILSSLFLLSTLGMGLLISTLTKSQFNAAVVTLNAAFLPAMMLSGFVFDITSMPKVVQLISSFIPARYFVSAMHTLFLAGNVFPILMLNALFLGISALFFIGLTALKTKRRLD